MTDRPPLRKDRSPYVWVEVVERVKLMTLLPALDTVGHAVNARLRNWS